MRTAKRLGVAAVVRTRPAFVIAQFMPIVLMALLVGLPATVSAQSQSSDATLSGLTLSGVNFGTFASGTTSYTASVASSVTQTTVTPSLNHSGASYVIKLGGVVDADRVIALDAGSNVITIEVTAEDDSTTKTYTVTVTRAAPPISAPDLYIPSMSTLGYSLSFTLGVTVKNQGSGASGPTTLRYYRSTDSAITTGDAEVGTDAVDGLAASESSRESIDLSAPSAPGTYYYGACVDAVSNESNTTNNCPSGSVAVTVPGETSTDATLSALTLSDVPFGTFAPGTTSYTASVANSVTETTVTPTVNDSGASYVIKLGGVTDADGVVSLSVGSNVIAIEVTAEDDTTTRTYTVTVTRLVLVSLLQKSTDATLSALTLSGMNFGTFASGTTSYTASVANSVTETTVTPTVNDSGASYVIKLGGVTDADGVVSLSVGSNVIAIEVTAEDDTTTRTYTVTVTRAEPPSTDATLSGLTLSGIDFGTFASGTTSYSAQVANTVSQTTVTPTVNHSGATYVIKLGGVVDADRVIALDAGSNVITIEVTAEDDSTTKTYTVTVTRAAAPISAPDLVVPSVVTFSSPFGFNPSFTLHVTVENQGSGSSGSTTLRYYRSTDSAITSGDAEVGTDAVDGLAASGRSIESIDLTAPSAPGTYYYGACVDAVSNESNTTNNCSPAIAFTVPAETSTDATLSALTLSDVPFGTFASGTTSYTASVANSVTETTVTPTVNDSGASYVIKLDGVTDVDGVVSLSVGSNVITVEVSAEDDQTTQTYTVTVTRAENSAPTGAPTISGTAQVGQTLTVDTSRIADEDGLTNASFGAAWYAGEGYLRVFIGQGRDLSYTVSRRDVGMTLDVTVNFKDDAGESHLLTSEKTATVSATYPAAPENFAALVTESGDVNLSWEAPTWDLGGEIGGEQTWGDGGSDITGYVVQWKEASDSWGTIADVSEATETGTSHTIDGLTGGKDYSLRVLAVNAIGRGIPSDAAAVTLASTDATLSTLTLSGVDFGTFAPGSTSYTAQVANSVSQTTVTPTANDSGASYVTKLGGVTDVDGVVSLSVGSNVITVEVTAEDDNTTQTYTVTITRAAPPSTDATLSTLTLSGVDFGTFAPGSTSYTAQVANSVTETTVTPTVNHSGASYVIKLGGVTDADGVVSLDVGSNVITVEVTAEDDNTTQTYTVTITRAAPSNPGQLSGDAKLSALTLSGIDFGTFDSTTTSYTARVANSVTETTVTPTVNHAEASYVIKIGGVTDADGVVLLSVGSNVITVEVTAEDDSTTRTYTVTVTRAAPESNVEMLRDLYDSNDDGVIDRDETVAAIRDYFAGDLTRDETIEVIKLYFSAST